MAHQASRRHRWLFCFWRTATRTFARFSVVPAGLCCRCSAEAKGLGSPWHNAVRALVGRVGVFDTCLTAHGSSTPCLGSLLEERTGQKRNREYRYAEYRQLFGERDERE